MVIDKLRQCRLTEVSYQILDQPTYLIAGKLRGATELWWPRPPAVREIDAVPGARLGIAWDDVEVDIGVHHHQHQVIDPLVSNEAGERPLDERDAFRLFSEGFARKGARGCGITRRGEHQRAQSDLRRA